MKLKRVILKVLLTIVVLVTGLYFLFVFTDVFLPSTKEIQNSEQLLNQVVNELTDRLKNKDTLYLATERTFTVCGNEPNNDNTITFSEKVQKVKSLLNNPYYINFSKYYNKTYAINGQIIILGTIIDNDFISENHDVQITSNSENQNKEIYEMVFAVVKKNEVIIDVIDSYKLNGSEKNTEKIKFAKIKSIWKAL